MFNFELTGVEVLLYTFSLALLTFLLIITIKRILTKSLSAHKEGDNRYISKTKYRSHDEMKLTGLLFKYGLLVSISFTLFAFNWSIKSEEVNEIIRDEIVEETEITPPITHFNKPKPLPPPPPPPKIIPSISEVLTSAPVFKEPIIDLNNNIDSEIDTLIGHPSTIVPPPPPPPIIKEEEQPVLITAEQMPRFPGCEDIMASFKEKEACANKELLKYLYKNIKYPGMAKENLIEGTAVVRFTVSKDGSIKDINLLRDPGAGLGDEAIRVVKKMNEMSQSWTPGKQRGKPVAVLFTLPISFTLKN